MSKPDIVLCTPVRTSFGTYGGSLKDTPAMSCAWKARSWRCVRRSRDRNKGLINLRTTTLNQDGKVVQGFVANLVVACRPI